MILICPACDTKYVVKDDAIPPGGRQVRCASCKHSWHQDSSGSVVEAGSAAVEYDRAGDAAKQAGLADIPEQADREGLIAGEPQPEVTESVDPGDAGASQEPPATPTAPGDVSTGEAPEVDDQWRSLDPAIGSAAIDGERRRSDPLEEQGVQPEPAEDEFVGYAPIADNEPAPRRRWLVILAILLLVVAAAAAFWFLAPAEWKQRAGIGQAGATPLQLMITTNDRQPLESGNELIAISGRVINPTDREQPVPPIQAELRDKQTKAVVHRWTIAPPARVLAPRSSASFNSAEIDVPKGGDELTITLGPSGS